MMSQKWTKRVIGGMAIVLALVILGSVFLPVLANAAALTGLVLPATGDTMLVRMLAIMVIALVVVVAGIIISIIKKRRQDKGE